MVVVTGLVRYDAGRTMLGPTVTAGFVSTVVLRGTTGAETRVDVTGALTTLVLIGEYTGLVAITLVLTGE